MAETITLGKVSVSPKGAYSSTASYTFLDAVSHNGGAFLCLQNSTGVEPGVSSGWQSSWMETSKGIQTVSITSQTVGEATITVTLSDGTQTSATISTTALADGSVTADKLADSAKALTFTVTLTAAGWSNNTQTISNAYFSASGYKYDVAPAPASFIAYGEAIIYCENITADGQATFVCQSVPTVALTVNIGRTVAV